MAAGNVSAPDTALVGIFFRPANGSIYGLGNAGGLYVLDPAGNRPELKARLNVALEGRSFGLDFNPTVDRLRVISDSGQNLRITVDTGAVTVDGFLKSGPARSRSSGSRFRSDVAGQRVRLCIPAIDVWESRTRGSNAW